MSSDGMCEIPYWVYRSNPRFWAKQAIKDGGLVVCSKDSNQAEYILSPFFVGKKSVIYAK